MFVIFYLQPLSTVSGPRGQAGTCVQPLVLAVRDTRHGFESVITQNLNLADSAAKDFHMRPECASTRAAWVSGGFLLFYLFSILYMKHVCVHVHLVGILGMLYRLALAIGRETRLCNLGCKNDDASINRY